ncbi:hypothetical protein DFQ29_010165 [Apophysomyces sp. BC1021]|nr:hypothetical protein DFQ29_010165 [Apophysomyces sp. BC1021]
MAEGLSQDDFRKLLQTPRAPPSGDQDAPTPRFKAPPKTPQVPTQYRCDICKASFGEKEKPDDDSYRDRAAERRSGQDSEVSAEQLLRGSEADETLDAKQVYDQSKYLGGDVGHTHLVKGLDFSLLHKVREDLEKKKEKLQQAKLDADAEDELDDVLDRIDRGESLVEEESTMAQSEEEPVQFDSIMAKNIYDSITKPKVHSERNEFFVPGRMAFVFELADEVGHYSDAFAIPTSVIRSKADVVSRRHTMGWSDDMETESQLVMNKISQVMSSIRNGNRHQQNAPVAVPVKAVEKPKAEPIVTFDGDIFEGVGRDYELDEEEEEKSREITKGSYFTGLYGEPEEKDEDVEMTDTNDQVSALLSQATEKEKDAVLPPSKRRRQEQEPEDVDAGDIDMFGLSTSVLPTSFEERQRTLVYDGDQDEDGHGPTSLVDQGSHRNKKAQLTRWDFDDEDEWQKYKDSVEIHPKSAFQFGVKLGDGRKRNREQRKGMNDKQKLNREYQQVKSLMDKKYGK